MMENSGKGAIIDLPSIPCPVELDLSDWLISFQSFGFILSVTPELSNEVVELFKEREIDASVIGKVIEEKKVAVRDGSKNNILFPAAVVGMNISLINIS